ncbi:MAG: MFS transporter [Candidatus Omnitrophica bacterium]|nr:MFS transporter [Candidatus Omnitrophota bacterium]
MLDFITLVVQPIVKIRKDEWPKTLLMFFYFFITITCLYILKPVRNSIFLEKSGFENLPYVWISTVLIMVGVVTLYVKAAGWVKKNILLIGLVLFFVSNIFVFWWLLGKDIPGLPFVFYIWVSIFSIMSATQFWTLANDIFNPREAKRLFGFIGSGGILGGMCGGYITGLLVGVLGTVNLLIIAAFILIISAVLIQWIWEHTFSYKHSVKIREESEEPIPIVEVEEKPKPGGSREALKNIWRSKYLLLLLTMVCLAKLVSTLVEYQFNGIVQGSFIGIDKKTAFFGWFWGMLNTVSFAIQFFLTSRVLRHLGIRVALLILPVGLLFGNMAILLNPAIWSAVCTMMYDGSMNYSLNQASKEVLYVPIAREIRYRVKPFIDMVGYRTAKGLGSVLILFMTHVLVLNMNSVSVLTLILIGVWVLAAFVMKSSYLGELRSLIMQEKGVVKSLSIQSSDDSLFYSAIDALSGNTLQHKYLASKTLNITHLPGTDYLLKNYPHNTPGELREKIKTFYEDPFHEGPSEILETKLYEELHKILGRTGLDSIADYAGFIASFRGREDIASMRIYLTSRHPDIQRAAFLLLVLFDETFDYEKLPQAFHRSLVTGAGPQRWVENFLFPLKNNAGQKMEHIRKKLVEYLDSRDGEKAFGLIEEFIRDEQDFMDVLEEFISEAKLPEVAVKKLTKILSAIPRQRSVTILERALLVLHGEKKNFVIEALSKIRLENPGLVFDEAALLKEINLEVKEYGKVLRLLSIYLWKKNISFNHARAESDLFYLAQENRLSEIVQRIFLILLLMSEPEDIRAAYTGFSHPSDYVRANALELLDNLLVPRLRHPVLSLLDGDDALPRIREKGIKDFHWSEERAQAYLKKNIVAGELLTSVSGIILMAKCHMKEALTECLAREQYSHPLVREMLILTHAADSSSFFPPEAGKSRTTN